MDEKVDQYLKDIYYNPKNAAAFSGPDKIYRFVKEENKFKLTRKNITDWIQSQENYTTNRLINYKFKRNKVIVPYIDYMWDCDTASLSKYSKENRGIGYFVLIIDIMSRYVWTAGVKSPTGKAVEKLFTKIIKSKRVPERVRSDKGTEFSNTTMKKFFKKHKIKHFVTQNEVKANYAERAIRTIKGKLFRLMRDKRSRKWYEDLASVTLGYNNTYHRSIKRSPSSVSKKDENELWNLLYKMPSGPLPKRKKVFKFEINDLVRISKLKKPFQRHYSEHWTIEVFKIKGRKMKENIPIYTLTDYGEVPKPIEGTFYENELQKVFINENTLFNIEEVVRTRIKNRREESEIKWLGWPKDFNTWIPTKEIKNYK